MLPIESPFKIYSDLSGRPLDNGSIYIGKPDLNPKTEPLPVFWDAEGAQPALQPLRTLNGYIVRAGTPANVFVDGNYSALVENKNGVQITYSPTSAEFSIASSVKQLISDLSGNNGSQLVGYKGTKVGAVLRTLYARAAETISVKDFGAVGDGVANDTAAIQQAITAAGVGGRIFFPSGDYLVTDVVKLNVSSMSLVGAGRQMVAIITTSASKDVFNVTGSDIVISEMNFQSRVKRTAGAYVNFASGTGHIVKDFAMQGPYCGVKMNCTNDEAYDGTIANTVPGGSSIIIGDEAYGFNQLVRNVIMDAAENAQPNAGIALYRTYDLRIESCEIQHQGTALFCLPGDGQIAYAVHSVNTFYDSNEAHGVHILVTGTGQANNFRFSNCWFGNNVADGVRMNCAGTGRISSIHFDNSSVISNGQNGFALVAGTEDISITGGSIQGVRFGVNVSAGISDWSVIGVSIGNYAGGGGASEAGIEVALGGSDRYVIAGNRFRGNGINMRDRGTGPDKVVTKNSGIRQASRGTEVITSGTSSVQVNHNLGFVPVANTIFISPNSDAGTNPAFVDASTINQTSFIVRCANNRTNNLNFNWSAGVD